MSKRQAYKALDARVVYFDLGAAVTYDEAMTTDTCGARVSRATDSSFEHEALHRTANGTWIVHHWSKWPRARATHMWAELTAEAAVAWLLRNEIGPSKLEDLARTDALFASALHEVTTTRGPRRKSEHARATHRIHFNVTAAEHETIATQAKAAGQSIKDFLVGPVLGR